MVASLDKVATSLGNRCAAQNYRFLMATICCTYGVSFFIQSDWG